MAGSAPCPGCGGVFPDTEGPVHRYMHGSPGCWAAFGEVLAREYSDPALMPVHRLSVDAYAVQHPGDTSRQAVQSVGLHLVRLCLFLERGLAPEAANAAMLQAGEHKAAIAWLPRPPHLGRVTVKDVRAAVGAAAHAEAVRAWARSAWDAWSLHHAQVRLWADAGRH